MAIVNVTFSSNDLQTDTRLMGAIAHESLADKVIETQAPARDDGEIITKVAYRAKTITVEGTLAQTTGALLDADIDTLKGDLKAVEGVLAIDYGGTTRNYTATCKDVEIVDRRINFTRVKLTFLCTKPYGYAGSATNHSDDTNTTSPFTGTITNAGSYKAKPLWTFTFAAVNTVTSFSFTNSTRGETIIVARTYAPADVLTINADTCEVKVNGTAVDYSGRIPQLDPGANAYSCAVTGTSFTVNMDGDYTRRDL